MSGKPEAVTLDSAIDTLFRIGILDRLAPTNREVIAARKAERRYVYDEGRNDPALYEKLYYSVENARENLAYSRDASWVNAWGEMLRAILMNQTLKEKIFAGVADDRIPEVFLDRLQERILGEYKKCSGRNELTPVRIGITATFHGIPVTIQGCNPNGSIRLEAHDEKGHAELYKFTNKGTGMDPAERFGENFVYDAR